MFLLLLFISKCCYCNSLMFNQYENWSIKIVLQAFVNYAFVNEFYINCLPYHVLFCIRKAKGKPLFEGQHIIVLFRQFVFCWKLFSLKHNALVIMLCLQTHWYNLVIDCSLVHIVLLLFHVDELCNSQCRMRIMSGLFCCLKTERTMQGFSIPLRPNNKIYLLPVTQF